jgi:hypothetical protein
MLYGNSQRAEDSKSFGHLINQLRSNVMAMKKLIATAVISLMISAPTLALAGKRGFSGSRGSSAFSSKQVKPGEPSQPKTGSIQDLGVNPSAKSPADMVKNRSAAESPVGVAPGPAPAPQSTAPGFFGSGGFGSSWMTWGILGYLFGRQHHTPHESAVRELELVPDPSDSR